MDNDSVNVRNLEQIQEQDTQRGGSRLATVLMASLGGAALVIAGVTTLKRSEPPAESKADPLAALLAKSKRGGELAPEQVGDHELDFPDLLSDEGPSTTALAAVKDERGRLIEQAAPQAAQDPKVPLAADRLPVIPLPAGTLLNATPATQHPEDDLTRLAAEASKVPEPTEAVTPGTEGGYQLQVASFRDQGDADAFVDELRKRGHRAYRQAAYVPDRGLWHRVRVGPFKSKFSARNYQKEYEAKERMSTFLVDPGRVERQRQVRAHKLAIREKKYGKP